MMKLSALFWSLCSILLAGCSWVNDNYDHCPTGTWIQLSYTYNMLYSEAVSTQVSNASVLVMDKEGNCVAQETADSVALEENHYRIRLPELPAGDYDILVWAGLNDSHYQLAGTEVTLRLDGEVQEEALDGLFFGRSESVTIDGAYRVIDVSLVKDTKLITTTLQLLSQQVGLDAEDFRLEICASNRTIDGYNTPSGTVSYAPFQHRAAQLDSLHVVQSGFHVLRLTVGDGARMRLVHVPTGSQVFDIPLTEYLVLAGMTDFLEMGEQEYLDREDHFNLLFFLNETQLPERPYTCAVLQIRSWVLRLNETELE